LDADQEREFRDFVALRSKSLLHTAYLLTGDWEHGRDLLQTALANTARRWPKLLDRDQPDAYVRRALYHAHVDRSRRLGWGRETLTAEPPDGAPSGGGAGPGPGADHADAVAQRQDLVAALRRLPKRQRAIVVLRYFEDRPDAEIADLLGITAGTVRSQTHKALTALRVTMRDQERATAQAEIQTRPRMVIEMQGRGERDE
jgi:RNA polymerase sigma-70 factor (sigma-E family)